MYRFILAIVLIIILSLSLKYTLLETFSIQTDTILRRAIQENNIASRKRREEENYNKKERGRYNSITEMEHIVQNLRDKVISAKEILNNNYPTCRKIDLYPNIDFTSSRSTRNDRFTDNFEQSYSMREDLIQSEPWNGRNFGKCSDYIPEAEEEIDAKKLQCRKDPYCRVVADNTNSYGFRCEYKQLNHKCYNTNNGSAEPVDIYFNPGTLDNI